MAGNHVVRYRNAAVLSVSALEAPEVVASSWFDECLADTFARCQVRPGLLERLAGVVERRWWPDGTRFDDVAARVGRLALDAAGVDVADVSMIISTAVSKHHLEPSVACAVHDHLGAPTSCLNFDLANACLGFVNAMDVAAAFIDAGHAGVVLIVDAEGSRLLQESTLDRLSGSGTTAADVFADFASLTLGSGAAAMVVGRADEHPGAHRIVGGTSRAATRHHGLCVGTLDRMSTDTKHLLDAGLCLAEATWADARSEFDWAAGMDTYIVHQVSSVHTSMLCERLALPTDKVPLTYRSFGNIGPASIPFTLANHQRHLTSGDRVLLLGIGSGLNTAFTELRW